MKIYSLYKLEQIDSPIHTLSAFLSFDVLSWLKIKGPVLRVLPGVELVNLRLILHILQSFEDSRHFWCSDSCCEKEIVDYIAIVYIYICTYMILCTYICDICYWHYIFGIYRMLKLVVDLSNCGMPIELCCEKDYPSCLFWGKHAEICRWTSCRAYVLFLIPFLGVAESSEFFLIHFCGFSFDGLFVRRGSYETDDFVAPDSMVYSWIIS